MLHQPACTLQTRLGTAISGPLDIFFILLLLSLTQCRAVWFRDPRGHSEMNSANQYESRPSTANTHVVPASPLSGLRVFDPWRGRYFTDANMTGLQNEV
ncbi:hypothetical protein J3F84DRAFT_361294 [Trichoderma pleuroticola]